MTHAFILSTLVEYRGLLKKGVIARLSMSDKSLHSVPSHTVQGHRRK